jgi:hypothetical protein
MSNQLGSPHIFFTLSPDAPNRLLVKYYAGSLSEEEYLTTITTPSTYHFNAPASAMYFDEQMQFFIRHILQFDVSAGASLGKGVFGTTKAFFGAIESQSTTNLHVHMLIWIEELPNCKADWEEKLQSQEFVQFLCNYADKIKSCSYPSGPTPVCPKCLGDIEAIPLCDSLKKKDNNRKEPPHTLKCKACFETFPYNFFRNHIHKHHVIGTESVLPLDSIGPLMQVQEHDYNHRKSCFKKSVRTTDTNECRFQMPCPPHPVQTELIDGQIIYQRDLGCEYLNGYNPILARVFPGDNHDIQLLIGGTSTKEVSYYTMKYATKKQQKIENLQNFIYHEWIEKRKKELSRTQSLSTSQLGFGRLSSMVYQLSKYNEVPATIASLYLLRESGFYISHSFTSLSLYEATNFCQNLETQANIVHQPPDENIASDAEPQYAVIRVLDDYLYRPDQLENMCWFQFINDFTRKTKPSRTQNIQNNLDFKFGHPLFETHTLGKQSRNVIVTLISRRLPKSTTTIPDDLRYFYLSCLIMFKPFNDIAVFEDWIQNLQEIYAAFIIQAPQWVKNYIENNDDYWSQVETQTQQNNPAAQAQNSLVNDDNDERHIEDFDEYDYIDNDDDIPESALATHEEAIQYHFRISTEILSCLTNLPALGNKKF